jgi:hypothetical protein
MSDEMEGARQLVAQLAGWDTRILEVAGITGEREKKLNLIFRFEPDPPGDVVGFFWIANLLTRIDFERLEIQQPFDLGFRIGEQVFLSDGHILKQNTSQVILWPSNEQ